MMANVTVDLPSMLSNVLGGTKRIEAAGTTCREALQDAFSRHPGLEVHLLDEEGELRQHVLCFINEENTNWSDGLEQSLADGDRITILQAVSGG